MELTQLKYFMEVAQSCHVTRSAKRLHIAQPALSRSIHRLEEELGVPLFVSRGRGVALTRCGQYLLERITPAMEILEALPEDIAAVAGADNSTVHMSVAAASALVTESIIKYRESNRVNFRLAAGADPALADISVYTQKRGAEHPAEHCRVFTEKIFLAVPSHGKYAEASSVRLSDMAEEEFICLSGTMELRSICDSFCRAAGFSPRIGFESDNPAAVQNLVAAGFGVGFWPEHSWGRFHPGGAVLMPVADVACSRDIVISYNLSKSDCSAVTDYYDFLVSFFEKKSADPVL
jgi:DNA-binding transcriptional LysR family regulator